MSKQSTQNTQNWEIALKYGYKIYYIKTKNPKRTLTKILTKASKPDEVAIKPPRSYYWYVSDKDKIKMLIDGEEVELPVVFHYPPRGGDAVGKGWLKLP